jgi:hypothetical protein
VPTEMLTKQERRDYRPAPAPIVQEPRTYLTWKDLAGTAVAALAALVYVANVQDWWYLGSNRWAAVTMLAVGAVGCPLGARIVGERLTSLPIVLLGLLGVAALTLAILAIVTGAQWALLSLAILVVALWVGATLRHAATPPPRIAAP